MYNPFPATVESSTSNLPENYYKISSSCPRKFPLWGSPVVPDSLQKVNPRSPTPPLALCRTFPHLLLQCGFDHLEDTRLTGWSSAQLTSLQLRLTLLNVALFMSLWCSGIREIAFFQFFTVFPPLLLCSCCNHLYPGRRDYQMTWHGKETRAFFAMLNASQPHENVFPFSHIPD